MPCSWAQDVALRRKMLEKLRCRKRRLKNTALQLVAWHMMGSVQFGFETCSNQWIYDIFNSSGSSLTSGSSKKGKQNATMLMAGWIHESGFQGFFKCKMLSNILENLARNPRNTKKEKINIKSATATWWCQTVSSTLALVSLRSDVIKLKTDSFLWFMKFDETTSALASWLPSSAFFSTMWV